MVSAQAGQMWDSIVGFVGQTNTAISTVASPAFRDVIRVAFSGGFEHGSAKPKADIEQEFKTFCPVRGTTTIRKYVVQAGDMERQSFEAVLKENKFAAMTMDAGQVGTMNLFITNLVAAHLQCCFTARISQPLTPHTHWSLNEFLKLELDALAPKGIIVAVIICDGASYQTKSLNYQDPESLQASDVGNLVASQILYMPCLCHRLNNAYRRLVRDSDVYAGFIRWLRELAVFCRKPEQRRRIGAMCPAFIETRWLYDYRILQFVLRHEAVIQSLGVETSESHPIAHAVVDLLILWVGLVTALEGSSCSLGLAYPTIHDTTNTLARLRDRQENSDVKQIYSMAIKLINQYTIDSTYDLTQLAYVLTPAGRNAAYDQMQQVLVSAIPSQQELVLELVDFDEQLAGDEGLRIGDAQRDGEEEEEIADDDNFTDPNLPEFRDAEVALLSIPGCEFPSSYLAHRARIGLDRILDQFRSPVDQTEIIHRAFQHYISSVESAVGVMQGLDPARYCWLSAPTQRREYALLADIALRLEPAICSEAPSERSIGEQRRFLLPHRSRTNTDLLLARTTMEDRRNQEARSRIKRPP
jgi:hypothetical protein